jgi:hypothetical protein
MATQHNVHSTLLICGVGFQHRTCGEERNQQSLGMYRFLQFK